jgi:uncharacterized glyoxalase superfamily protein PhnB/DNA-binding CsgD family transcriptional regulator
VLTPGEWRVATAARYGMTNREIAERLGVSIDAVKFHLGNILLKLGFDRRQELLGWSGMPAQLSAANEEKLMSEMSAASNPSPHIPPGFTRLFPYLFVEGARDYLEFLEVGLGGRVVDVHASPDGIVRNAHVRFGDTTIMVSEATEAMAPTRGTFYLYVEDADRAMEGAGKAGGETVMPVEFQPYGERQGGVRDPAGNIWWLSQRLSPGGY